MIENTSLTGSFMKVLNLNRFTREPENQQSRSFKEEVRKENSEATSLEDGEQRYETDDEKN